MLKRLALILLAAACSPAPTPDPPAAQSPKPAASAVTTVPSKDGTPIAVECMGEGATLLIVHGGVGDRTRWTPMLPLLSQDMRVCAMDRRGRGGSGDAPDYGLHKEAEDVAAVAASLPGEVYVMGHSYGGIAAYEATFLTGRIGKLILYEAPFQDPVDRNLATAEKVEALIAAGKPEEALIVFQTDIGQQSPDEIERMKSRPNWPLLVETIKVHPRQMRALAAYRFDPERMKSVSMPALLLMGEDTVSPHIRQAMDSLNKALPNSTLVVLAGQQHNAMDSDRTSLATAIRSFLSQ